MDMLSAKKVRMHGMQSSRWTIKDKLTQYKGLINLYTRDRKILTSDSLIAKKKQTKEIKQLVIDIKNNREKLVNSIRGDRQKLRNTLADHKELQLGFQNLPPIRSIEHLHQDNFKLRKQLDRTNYRMKQKTQTLISLKLELSELEDLLVYEGEGQLPVEEQAQIVTGKVQDAILKKEAAIAVRATYKNILSILKKDSIYFDAVLGTLTYDGYVQSKCIIRTTELGQLATEYVDDRKQELKELQKVVKQDMKAREQSLKLVRKEVADLTGNMGLLIRRDSDINLGKVQTVRSSEDVTLQKDLKIIEEVLTTLQEATYVSNFDEIYPCLIEQQRQSTRLKEILEQSVQDKEFLANKKNHAEKMYTDLLYIMNTTTLAYIKDKERLNADIQEQVKRKERAYELTLMRGNLSAKIRSSLQQLAQKCTILKMKESKGVRKPMIEQKKSPPTTPSSKSPKSGSLPSPKPPQPQPSSTLKPPKNNAPPSKLFKGAAPPPPPYIEQDALKIIDTLIPKLTLLVSSAAEELDREKQGRAYKYFQELQNMVTPMVQIEEEDEEESLLTDIVMEDSSVPNYNDIKAKSKQLVDISSIDEDMLPVVVHKTK